MKKNHLFAKSVGAILFALFIVSCENPNADTGSGSKPEAVLPDKVIWEPETDVEREFVTASEENYKESPKITFDEEIDLTGYKYINIELSSPNNTGNVIGIDGISITPEIMWPEDVSLENYTFEFASRLTNESKVYQVCIEKYPKHKLNTIYFYAVCGEGINNKGMDFIGDIKVNLKKISVTNKKLNTDYSKDTIVYSSSDEKGYKLTTIKDDYKYFVVGPTDLEGYKYLNFELYCPDNKNTMIEINGWGWRECEVSFKTALSNETITVQAPYGTSRGTWTNWEDGHDVIKPSTSDIVGSFFIAANIVENGYDFIEGVDIYIKKIYATNTKQDTKKDKDLFISSTTEPLKITTLENDSVWLAMYGQDLTGYEYINVELYSPDAENKIAAFDGWNGDVTVFDLEGFLDGSSKTNPKVIQAKINDNTLGGLCVYVRENGSDNWAEEGIDVYIKRIYATNKKISIDTSKDRILFQSSEENGFKTATPADGNLYRNIYLGTNDLTGYKYLNVELGIPKREKNYYFTFDGWGDHERVATSTASLLDDTVVLQSLFGTNNGTWNDWIDNKTVVKQSTSNNLGNICIAVREAEGGENLPNLEFYVKRVWATNTRLENNITEDKIVYKSPDADGYKFCSEDDWKGFAIYGNNSNGYDLTGYKYLNIELYSPNSGANSVTIDCWGDNERVATFNSILTSESLILQSAFGKNYNETNASNILGFINLGAHYYGTNGNSDWVLTKGVDIYIKRIWATNTEYVNDTTKDRDIFIAAEVDGYKITTEDDWRNFTVGERDLSGYKYLNMELYSPNSENYDIKIDGWSTERVSVVHTKLTSTPKIVQVPFGVNRGTWEDEIDGVWQDAIPSTTNLLWSFALGAHLGNNWDLKDGIDIYIKRIWVTNTKL